MRECTKFYIGGEWVDPAGSDRLDVINPATEKVAGVLALGTAADVDRAVKAARKAFPAWSSTTMAERLDAMGAVISAYQKRLPEMAAAITEEMGAPEWLAMQAQAPSALAHFMNAMEAAKTFKFHEDKGASRIAKEPIGVCGFITPWNWPINQIAAKFAPALMTGCTMVLKPSEIAPFSAHLFAEIVDAAGLPAGVFNLVHGDGPTVGAAIASHPDIDMVSFTGSTRAGVEVARNAAPTVKRVHQELGGKSPNIILDDANLEKAVTKGVQGVMMNSGQSCNAPTRMLVPQDKLADAIAIAQKAVEDWQPGVKIGPVVSQAQFDKIQTLIHKGTEEGAQIVAGGAGKPDGLETGYYVRPTIFANVSNDMTIAREEIFGPVLSIIAYDNEDEAIAIANDTEYGLAGYVQSGDLDHARKVAAKIRAGYITINNAGVDFAIPFGGYKKSGNGREWGECAFDEFLELKSLAGYNAA